MYRAIFPQPYCTTLIFDTATTPLVRQSVTVATRRAEPASVLDDVETSDAPCIKGKSADRRL